MNLLEVGLDETTASAALLSRVDGVLAWIEQYMGPEAQAKGAALGAAPNSGKGGLRFVCLHACVCVRVYWL